MLELRKLGTRRQMQKAFMVFKAINDLTPQYLKGKYGLEKVALNYENFSPGIRK